MASNNSLLGSGIKLKVEKKKPKTQKEIELGWPKRLYRKDCLTGKVVQTLPEQEKHIKNGWVESPSDLQTE